MTNQLNICLDRDSRDLNIKSRGFRDYNYDRDPGIAISSGRPSILSNIAKRHIIRECSNKITTAKTIKANLDLNCSTHTVQRVISSSPLIERKTLKRKPALKQIP